jgi:hypothetical protein
VTYKPPPDPEEIREALARLAEAARHTLVLLQKVVDDIQRIAPQVNEFTDALRKCGLPEAPRWRSPKRPLK